LETLRPKKRSRARIAVGKLYYTFRRYLYWHFGNVRFAKEINKAYLPVIAFIHKTPLLRKLKNVDMWMQYNKISNLKLAVEKLNGIMVKPGETFSYWRLIGRPTKAKGYKEGMVLFYGGFKSGVGGGMCQLSNLIYWMTLHSPLKVIERYRHSFDVFPDVNRTQPFGSGATCVYNYRDLQIYNDTDRTYQLHLYLDEDYLHGEWRTTEDSGLTYEVYEKRHWISQEYWGGYVRHNEIFRRVFDNNDDLIRDEYIAENHALMMYSPLLSEVSANKEE
jgi:vancomycin resistance protein VanW